MPEALRMQSNRDNLGLRILMTATCVLSNLSQLPYFVDLGLSSALSTGLWAVCGVFVILFSRFSIRRSLKELLLFDLLFVVALAINTFLFQLDYWSSSHIRALLSANFVFIIGCCIANKVDRQLITWIIWGYVLSSCIVALDIYFRFFADGFNISTRLYAYKSKNSISQILLTSIILLLFGLSREEKKKRRILVYGISLALLVLIGLLKSRATILGVALIYLLFLRNKQVKLFYKVLVTAMLIAAVIVVLTNKQLNKLVINDILFANRDSSDLDELSSGRVTIIEGCLANIKAHFFEGVGGRYTDCYPLATVEQFGIVPGVILWVIALLPLIYSFREIRERRGQYRLTMTLMVVAAVYELNGLFECLTPLGPGVKCYLLWLLFGMLANGGIDRLNELDEEDDYLNGNYLRREQPDLLRNDV